MGSCCIESLYLAILLQLAAHSRLHALVVPPSYMYIVAHHVCSYVSLPHACHLAYLHLFARSTAYDKPSCILCPQAASA